MFEDGFLVLINVVLAVAAVWSNTARLVAVLVVGVYFLRDYLSPEKDLKGEVVVLTGAGSGIGRLMALKFAKMGCKLALWDINADGVESVAKECEAAGSPKVATFCADVSSNEKVAELGKQVLKDFKQVDILVNNAGIVTGKNILDVSCGAAYKTVEVNTIAHFWTVKAFLPGMIKRDHGHIVTVASAAGLLGTAGLADYCASKFGAVGFDEAIRMDMRKMRKFGVKTTCVCPYYINTGMFKGVNNTTLFRFLIPILEPEYVVDNVIKAIRKNQPMLCLPSVVYTIPLLRFLTPVHVFDMIVELLGLSNTMDHFEQTRPSQGK